MNTRTTINVRTRVEFIHRYKNAPEAVKFLREWHRHMLHITFETEVTHEDRELEFILIKRSLERILKENIDLTYVEKSCETVGLEIAQEMKRLIGQRYMKIEVSEDGENGAVVEISKED